MEEKQDMNFHILIRISWYLQHVKETFIYLFI